VVVDGEGRLLGIVTQSDLVAALYRSRAAAP
jgi:CBS-domain-containing membrane protein